jgi:hypothetical protein
MRIDGICVLVGLGIRDDYYWKRGGRDCRGGDCCPVCKCWSYCKSCINAGDHSGGYSLS